MLFNELKYLVYKTLWILLSRPVPIPVDLHHLPVLIEFLCLCIRHLQQEATVTI